MEEDVSGAVTEDPICFSFQKAGVTPNVCSPLQCLICPSKYWSGTHLKKQGLEEGCVYSGAPHSESTGRGIEDK